jgi:Mg-chelatase subunit ChlD
LTVSDKARIRQELTPVFENFRQQLDGVSAGGNTAVYDALDTARAMLVNYRSDLPKLRKRIVIVTDGADTSSENRPREVCFAIQRNGIVVDSVQVGDLSDQRLHAISVATGINDSFCLCVLSF